MTAPFIAIGIDFGTTYSGVSWALSTNPSNITVIQEWPTSYHNHQRQVQVPSTYDIKSGKWGYEVTQSMSPMKWFKLLLLKEEDISNEEIRRSEHLQIAKIMIQNYGVTPIEVVGKYLGKLWKHAYDQIKSRLDADGLPLKVAITVPAIWPPYAQKTMRDAARIAGILDDRDIGETTLDLIQEPEAAGLSTLYEREQLPEIKAGESFIVCDAGGGTVDVISYTIQSINPLDLRECVRGEGNLSGAFRIDEAFENHLRWKTKLKLASLEESEYNVFVTEDWEMGAKRSFTGNETQERFALRPPAKAYKRRDRWRGKDSFSLSKEEMRQFFSPSHVGIRDLISSQHRQVLEATGKEPRHILLVGGLGGSPYIYNVLQQQFRNTVLRPLRLWSAVADGAVLRILRDKMSSQNVNTLSDIQLRSLDVFPQVTSRKSRYNYGINVSFPIDRLDDFDPMLDTVRIDAEGEEVTSRLRWYLRKGEDVKVKSPVRYKYFQNMKRPTSKCVYTIRYCALDSPPKRVDGTVFELCRIECEWDIPFEDWEPVGEPDEGWRQHRGLVLAMHFAGEPEWKMEVGPKKAEHKVNVEYM